MCPCVHVRARAGFVFPQHTEVCWPLRRRYQATASGFVLSRSAAACCLQEQQTAAKLRWLHVSFAFFVFTVKSCQRSRQDQRAAGPECEQTGVQSKAGGPQRALKPDRGADQHQPGSSRRRHVALVSIENETKQSSSQIRLFEASPCSARSEMAEW